MPKLKRFHPLVALPLLLPAAATADVFKYVDKSGHVYYTDKPQHSGYRLLIRSAPSPGFEAPIKLTFAGTGKTFTRARASHPSNGVAAKLKRAEFSPLIEAAAHRYSVDPELLHAVIRAESSYNPSAVSNKGAIGLMQLMPGTAARYGVNDPYDPEENIAGGARYLSDLMDMFGSDVRLAVAAYNAGENNVIKYGHTIPPFAETREYVARVLDYYTR